MRRALSVNDLLSKKYKLLDFSGDMYRAFGNPEACGIWFIWGRSGNGKTSFTLQLAKEIARTKRVAYNSLEESSAYTMQQSFERHGMIDVAGNLILLEAESIEDMSKRMLRQKSPDVYVVDSFQHAGLTYRQYIKFKEKHRNKLTIFISHAEGKQPKGNAAKDVMFDAALKIWIEGYRAFSKGRYIGENGGKYDIWAERALMYWGDNV